MGQDEPEDPDNPNNPDNPQKPEHPDVAPEDRLTWVETTYTEVYSDGSSTDKSYMLFEYDAEGLLTGYDQYDYDSEQTDKINASYEGTLKRSEGKITDEEKWFEIGGSSYEGMPLPNSGEYTKEYRLNASGLVSGYTDPDGASQTFTYTPTARWLAWNTATLPIPIRTRPRRLPGRTKHRFHFDHRRTG